MVRRCVFGCSPPQTLFPFPKTQWLRSKWLDFVHFEESGISSSSQLCARHFTEDNFVNVSEHKMGFAAHLSLRDTAIPSIYTVGQHSSPKDLHYNVQSLRKPDSIRVCEAQFDESDYVSGKIRALKNTAFPRAGPVPIPSASIELKPSTKDVGCQYEAPKMKVASTQVGVCAPNKPRRRSKAIQVRPRGTSICCSTDDLSACPSPPFMSASVKKPRLEFSSASCLSPMDNSKDSIFVPEAFERVDGSPSHFQSMCNAAKYLVYEDKLMELLKACPTCLQPCTIEKHVMGTFLSVTQTCHHCLQKAHWNSQPFIGKIPADNLQLSSPGAFSGDSSINAHEHMPPRPDSILTCIVKCEPSDEEDCHEDLEDTKYKVQE